MSNHPTADFIVLGAGVVGLTVALELKQRNPQASVVIIEKEPSAGRHASGRNSGVLHSGIYYPPSTLKSKVCIEGSRAMQRFALEHGISCLRAGKIIVATNEREKAGIDTLMANAAASNIAAERLDGAGIRRLEPNAQSDYGGLYSPNTCVIDISAVIRTLVGLLEKSGVKIFFDTPIASADPAKKQLTAANGDTFNYSFLINCAGAYADTVAHWFDLAKDYVLVPFKGIYFQVREERDDLIRSSIYPVPNLDLPFLGVHFTRVANGKIYVGPTAIPAFGRENYGFLSGLNFKETLPIIGQLIGLYRSNQNNMRNLVNIEARKYLKPFFVEASKKLVPSVTSADLVSCSKVGIRPQLINIKKRALEMDYILEREPGSLHVLNAISPAFTSSFAFAKYIVNKI